MNTARKLHAISPRQIKAIHTALSRHGIADDVYRLRLATYGAKSCKDLTRQQAEELLDGLNGKTATSHKSPVTSHRLQYSDLDNRPGFASGAQLRLVAAMFAQVTHAPAEDPEGREKALNAFVNRITGVAALRMVRTYQVEKIVKALESMGAIHKGGKS